jgi:hypothetical protein
VIGVYRQSDDKVVEGLNAVAKFLYRDVLERYKVSLPIIVSVHAIKLVQWLLNKIVANAICKGDAHELALQLSAILPIVSLDVVICVLVECVSAMQLVNDIVLRVYVCIKLVL